MPRVNYDRIMRKPIGRPAGANSKDTRSRILRMARSCFIASGYSATSLTAIAEAADLTPASIYFHFGNKEAVFVAAAEEVRDAVLNRFRAAVAPEESFLGKVDALLNETVRIHRDDPQLAGFVAAAGIDAKRHPELAEIVQDAEWIELYRDIVETGCRTGEIRSEDRFAVRGLLWSMITGLSHSAASLPLNQYQAVVDAYGRLFRAQLVEVATVRAPKGRRAAS